MSLDNNKDHFVPKFYLKRWMNETQKLWVCQYIEHIAEFRWSDKHPSGVCYQPGLYGELEERFFKPLDNDAANLTGQLDSIKITSKHRVDLSEKDHVMWATFILAQIFRSPENIRLLENKYEEVGVGSVLAKKQIPSIIKDGRAINNLRSLKWVWGQLDCKFELITSENPLIFTPRDLADPNCLIILPMTPKHFFIACSDEAGRELPTNSREMAAFINREILTTAKDKIFARSKNSIAESFICKHWKK